MNTTETSENHFVSSDSSKRIVLTLSGSQDVRAVAELQRLLLDHFSQEHQVSIDCSAIETLDAAFLQLLLAAKREQPDQLKIMVPTGCQAARWIQYSGLSSFLCGGESPAQVQ